MITLYKTYFEKLKNRFFIGEFFWVGLSQVITLVMSIILIRILTQNLNPNEFGKLSLIITLGTLVSVIPSAYFLSGIERMYSLSSVNNEINQYIAAIKKMAFVSVFHCLTIMLLLGILLKFGFPQYWVWKNEIFISVLFFMVASFSTALTSIFNAARKRSLVTFYSFLDNIIKVSLVIFFAYFGFINVFTVLILYLLGVMITLVFKYISFINQITFESSSTKISKTSIMSWKNKMYNYSKPFVYFQLFTWAHTSSDRWALEMYSTTENAGYLVILLQLGYTPVIMFTGVMITFISPIMYDVYADGSNKNKIKTHDIGIKISYVIIFISLILTIIAFFLHDFIFKLLTTEDYHSVSYLLPWVTFAGGLFSGAQMLFTKISAELRVNELIKPKVITAIFGVCMNFFCVYFWEIKGAVLSLVLFSTFYFLWMLYLSKYEKILSRPNEIKK